MAEPFEAFFRAYARAFDDFDAERIASFYACPCMLVDQEVVVCLDSDTAILKNMRALVDAYRSQGYGRATVHDLRVDRQAENLATARVRWRIRDRGDVLLSTWLNSYNMRDDGRGWKILVSTVHAEGA